MTFFCAHAGLDLLLPVLEEAWGVPVSVGAIETLPYPIYMPGNFRPLPSSAVRISVADQSVWIPAPVEPPDPEQGLAPLYLHASQFLVMPTIRLCVKSADAETVSPPEFLSLSHWLLDAVRRWKFVAATKKGEEASAGTVLDQLRRKQPIEEGLRIVALMIRYALFGSDRVFTLAGLRLPVAPMWVRPASGTDFARRAARSLVISARLGEGGDPAKGRFPSSNLRSESYRIHPNEERDAGIDPVHTPEGNDIRLTGRLGVGVSIGPDRRLQDADDDKVSLSSSAARLPFAGYDDPRRLLMAANFQIHAVPLQGQPELPFVRQSDQGIDPPGVNLRVAFLAWQGWNHEDAWVLSESAARKLAAILEQVRVIAVRAVEEVPELLIRQGDRVSRGQLLVRRRMAPGLLCSPLEMLGNLDLREGKACLAPEREDIAPWAGEVVLVEMRDLRQDAGAALSITGNYRCLCRVTLRRTLPLAVGDKLANRHGHKGVVGAILPDEDMPRWRSKPLEALIDPISVLNRSNWGQVLETLSGAAQSQDGNLSASEVLRRAAATGADEAGRFEIEPPPGSAWMTRPARAVAGAQFVMRMPHHASDKISGSPLPPPAVAPMMHRRQQRFGEMDHWALWAHGLTAPLDGAKKPSSTAEKLSRLLASAGFDLRLDGDYLTVRQLPLQDAPPAEALVFPHEAGIPAEVYDALMDIAPDRLTVLVFAPPLRDVPMVEWEKVHVEENSEASRREKFRKKKLDLAWLPILPACDRPGSVRADGSEEMHELTRMLRRVIQLLRKRTGNADEDGAARYAVQTLIETSVALAIGLRATGLFNSKMALLRRGVMGKRLNHSARATATPAGTMMLALDEIGLPAALAWTLFGPRLPRDFAELARTIDGRRLWLKRDPVLHRWGLLSVRVRVVAGDAIRLPASLLGPLGADFDGDTVALFAKLPGGDAEKCSPPALAWHPLLDRALFVPGKQYLYGLHLLIQDAARREALQLALALAGAPPWPEGDSASNALREWVRSAAGASADGGWWALIERHALAALGSDPGMGFGWKDVAALSALEVVRCGAAKDLYRDLRDQEVMRRILAGGSLEIYRRTASAETAPNDPIADVMVAAKASIGRFGGALRRLIFSSRPPLASATLVEAQALTEQITQKALSVKGGKPPIRYGDFERQLRRLLRGESWECGPEEAELRALLEPLQSVWEPLRRAMADEPIGWLEWLRQPHELPRLLREAPDGILRLPLSDVRVGNWLE